MHDSRFGGAMLYDRSFLRLSMACSLVVESRVESTYELLHCLIQLQARTSMDIYAYEACSIAKAFGPESTLLGLSQCGAARHSLMNPWSHIVLPRSFLPFA